MLREILAGCALVCWASLAAANPSNFDPTAPLDVLPQAACISRQQAAFELWKQNELRLAEIDKRAAEGQLQQVNYKTFNATYVAAIQMQRISGHLIGLGQTAGYDFQWRAKRQHDRLSRLAEAYASLPEYSAGPRRIIIADMEQAFRAGKAQLEHLLRLAKNEEWESGEALALRILDGLDQNAVWFFGRERIPYYAPFEGPASECGSAMGKARRQQSGQIWAQLRDSKRVDLAMEVAAIDGAIASARQGAIVWAATPRSGPEFVAALVDHWSGVQLKVIRWRTFEQARLGALQASEPSPELQRLHEEYGRFSEKMRSAIVTAIEEDAQRAPVDKLTSVYDAYLRVLGKVVAHFADQEFDKRVEVALEQLGKRSPELQTRVKNYRNVTKPLLSWKKRVVSAQLKRLTPSSDALWHVVARGVQPDLLIRSSRFVGFVAGPQAATNEMSCRDDLPTAMALVQKRVMGQPTHCERWRVLPWEQRAAMSTYLDRTYAAALMMDSPLFAAAAINLRRDLLAKDGQAPLTIEAARALAALDSGDCFHLGGKIEEVHLESVLTRFAMLPESGVHVTQLGALPNANEVDLSQAICLRAVVTPTWIRHEHFLIVLP